MIRRIAPLILAIAVMATVAPATTASATTEASMPEPSIAFPDVGPGHRFHGEVDWLLDRGITGGYADGTFRPTAGLTRQAMAAWFAKFAADEVPGLRYDAPAVASFPDVPTSHPFFAEIEWMAAEGITTGYADGSFRPSDQVSRQAMAAYLYRFAGGELDRTSVPPARPTFADVPVSHPFRGAIEWMAGQGIARGYEDGSFGTVKPLSRQAGASFLASYAREWSSTERARVACAARTDRVSLTGEQNRLHEWRDGMAPGGAIDATDATWTLPPGHPTQGYPVMLAPEDGMCLLGGDITLTYGNEVTSWQDWQETAAISVDTPGARIISSHLYGVGDGVRFGPSAADWELSHVRMTQVHDECIQNDGMNGGRVTRSYFEGCYSFYGATSPEGIQGGDRTVAVTDSLIRLESMPSRADGGGRGHGSLFEVSTGPETGRSPHMELRDNIIRIDDAELAAGATHALAGYDPDGAGPLPAESHLDPATCARNTIVWLGSGPMPGIESLPASCFTVTTDVGVWEAAASSWIAEHNSIRFVAKKTGLANHTEEGRACLGRASVDLGGPQGTAYVPRALADGTAIDARSASWAIRQGKPGASLPVDLTGAGGRDLCFVGGLVHITHEHEVDSWYRWKRGTGISVSRPDTQIIGTRIHDVGDAITFMPMHDADRWQVRGVRVDDAHDDCIENDGMYNGLIDDSFFDGCFVFYSARDAGGRKSPDNTVTITDTLVHLKSMNFSNAGMASIHGPLFKVSSGSMNGRSPQLEVRDSIFRLDDHNFSRTATAALDTFLGEPYIREEDCSNNTIVWGGTLPMPENVQRHLATYPSCFEVTTDLGVWDRAVADWELEHPELAGPA